MIHDLGHDKVAGFRFATLAAFRDLVDPMLRSARDAAIGVDHGLTEPAACSGVAAPLLRRSASTGRRRPEGR
ncbi:hypothetical protein [Aurantimonas sp. 22II-16-19i]|uniref:hypothetical protein n=1 Tax=Aurantimonas sp. 22II-16-19i TaxID=1317114 RepID=UPI001594BFE7|nr:hypothetical protein [Aurantimonas sp. 22II-16-19i]